MLAEWKGAHGSVWTKEWKGWNGTAASGVAVAPVILATIGWWLLQRVLVVLLLVALICWICGAGGKAKFLFQDICFPVALATIACGGLLVFYWLAPILIAFLFSVATAS
jgi:hypothetical protein